MFTTLGKNENSPSMIHKVRGHSDMSLEILVYYNGEKFKPLKINYFLVQTFKLLGRGK